VAVNRNRRSNPVSTETSGWIPELFLKISPTDARWYLCGILILAILLRFWRLDSLCDGILWDEAYKGLDAIAIRKFGDHPIFLNWNAGREALIAYLVAASQMLFGNSIFAVRAVIATAGVVSICLAYIFSSRLWNRNVALCTAFLMAVSKWHLIQTRTGIRIALILVVELASLYFVARALDPEKPEPRSLLIAGAIVGIGFYTYIAFRVFPVVLILFALQPERRRVLLQHWKLAVVGILICGVIITPLVLFFVHHPEDFSSRLEKTAVWNTRLGRSKIAALAQSSLDTLGMFTFRGDPVLRHNVDHEPMLSPFSIPFFLIGMALVLWQWKKQNHLFLLSYFFFGLLPGILSVNAPHSARTLGAAPAVMILVVIGLCFALRTIQAVSPKLAAILLVVVLAGNLYTGPNDALLRRTKVLDELPPAQSSLWGMDTQQFRIAQLLNCLGERPEVYLSPQYYFHASIEYLTYSKSIHQLYSGARLNKESRPVIVVLQKENANLWWLRDDPGKRFFKWWEQAHGMTVSQIHALTTRMYGRYPSMTRMSDLKLLALLKRQYPAGKEINLGGFTAYIFRNSP
jgi:hypothetical protein